MSFNFPLPSDMSVACKDQFAELFQNLTTTYKAHVIEGFRSELWCAVGFLLCIAWECGHKAYYIYKRINNVERKYNTLKLDLSYIPYAAFSLCALALAGLFLMRLL